ALPNRARRRSPSKRSDDDSARGYASERAAEARRWMLRLASPTWAAKRGGASTCGPQPPFPKRSLVQNHHRSAYLGCAYVRGSARPSAWSSASRCAEEGGPG